MGRPIYGETEDTQCSSSSASAAATKTAEPTSVTFQPYIRTRNVARERRARLNRVLANPDGGYDVAFPLGVPPTQAPAASSHIHRETAGEDPGFYYNDDSFGLLSPRISYTSAINDAQSRPRPLRRAPPISHVVANMTSGSGDLRRHYGHWLSQPPEFPSDETPMHHFDVTRNGLLNRHEHSHPLAERATPNGPLAERATPNGPLAERATPNGPLAERATPDGPLAERATPDGALPWELVRDLGQRDAIVSGVESSSENQPPPALARVRSPSRSSSTTPLGQLPRNTVINRFLLNSRLQRTRARRNRMVAQASSVGSMSRENHSTNNYARMFSPTYSPDVLFTDDEGLVGSGEGGEDGEDEEMDESFGRIQAERMMERMADRQRMMSLFDGENSSNDGL